MSEVVIDVVAGFFGGFIAIIIHRVIMDLDGLREPKARVAETHDRDPRKRSNDAEDKN
jgi:hypothetical protein